ncbi:STAS domain-containing protein [bacterium]|nr:STAS domain-containing protein [bacterium]
MQIDILRDENKSTVILVGRLDTTTSPELESKLNEIIPTTKELIFDFNGLEYISSAGLRVMLMSQKQMNTNGCMKVINVCDDVKEIFDMTGFSDILTIE